MITTACTKVLAIDPGTTESAWCVFDGERIIDCDIQPNMVVLQKMRMGFAREFDVAIEMVASYGMPVGKEIFETVLWIGRFVEAADVRQESTLVYRKDVKLHLCQSTRAKDGNVRQAILDRFPRSGGGATPQVGTAKQPGPLYGCRSHVRSALAVAITRYDSLVKTT